MGDAIGRTLVRLYVTRRRLEWVTAAPSKAGSALEVTGVHHRMAGALVLALAAAAALHMTAEFMLRLHIGWFSYCMLVLACVCLLPADLLWTAGRFVAKVAETIGLVGITDRSPRAVPGLLPVALALVVVGTLMVGGGVAFLELPGTGTAGMVATSLLGAATGRCSSAADGAPCSTSWRLASPRS